MRLASTAAVGNEGEQIMDVVGIGLSVLDLLVRIDHVPDFESAVAVSQSSIQGGGPVATALVTVARLGGSAGYVGKVGRDLNSRLMLDLLRRDGVDTSRVVVDPASTAGFSIVLVEEATGRRGFIGCGRKGMQLRAEELSREYVTSGRYLHLDSLSEEAGLLAARWMREAGGKVVLDAAATRAWRLPAERLARLEHVDVLIAARSFARAATGEDDPPGAARALLGLGPEIVAVTGGEEGSWGATAGEAHHAPAFAVDVVDTTGAGDVYHGAFIYGLLQGWHLAETLRFSNAVAAIKCTRLGGRAGIPTRPQVESFLAER